MASCVRDPEVVMKNTMRGNVEALWQIIDEKYCFVEEKGLEWNGVLPIYQAKADSIEKLLFQYPQSRTASSMTSQLPRPYSKHGSVQYRDVLSLLLPEYMYEASAHFQQGQV